MRALIQRVREAAVYLDGQVYSQIDRGYLILLGVAATDTEAEADKLWRKIHKLRIFADDCGRTNLDLATVGGNVLIVSQFTLLADVRKGNRPSFIQAASPEKGAALCDYFVALARQDLPSAQTGSFGADMAVQLVNDGPFTIWLDTDQF